MQWLLPVKYRDDTLTCATRLEQGRQKPPMLVRCENAACPFGKQYKSLLFPTEGRKYHKEFRAKLQRDLDTLHTNENESFHIHRK
jgi:hypothetical protein